MSIKPVVFSLELQGDSYLLKISSRTFRVFLLNEYSQAIRLDPPFVECESICEVFLLSCVLPSLRRQSIPLKSFCSRSTGFYSLFSFVYPSGLPANFKVGLEEYLSLV